MATKKRMAKKRSTRQAKARRSNDSNDSNGSNGAIVVDDVVLTFEIKSGGGGKVKEIKLDPLVLRLFCQGLEEKHKLAERDGKIIATSAFLEDLAAGLAEMGHDVTPTVAYSMWAEGCRYFAGLQKKTSC